MGKKGRNRKALHAVTKQQTSLTLREESTGKKQANVNTKSMMKLDHLKNLAVWASGEASIPSLGAFFGHRMAACKEALGTPPDLSLFTCQRSTTESSPCTKEANGKVKNVKEGCYLVFVDLEKALTTWNVLCESVLQPGYNCTIRIEKNKTKLRHRRKKHSISSQNNVVYKCRFCSHRNLIRGTPRGYMKEICPQKPKPQSQSLPAKNFVQKSARSERGTKVEINSTDKTASPDIGKDDSATKGPATPLMTLLEHKRRKRNRSASKKAVESGSSSVPVDTEKAVSTSSKRRRKSWTSLKDIAVSDHGNSRNINNVVIPFFM
ncbi:hypothetical protein RJ639_033797 [Escallonia herrerae]|uniref:Uncharacterized protein n=1 Tax=Escallonia herrerae TaxID=1293975 RepID=A0AA88WUS7_9ASTE|nr:hypothetical protein RJ639_033797 [Escallonia herrerae]